VNDRQVCLISTVSELSVLQTESFSGRLHSSCSLILVVLMVLHGADGFDVLWMNTYKVCLFLLLFFACFVCGRFGTVAKMAGL